MSKLKRCFDKAVAYALYTKHISCS